MSLTPERIQELEKNEQRYYWLLSKVHMADSSMDGPTHPVLHIATDIWNSKPKQPAAKRMQDHIDAELQKVEL